MVVKLQLNGTHKSKSKLDSSLHWYLGNYVYLKFNTFEVAPCNLFLHNNTSKRKLCEFGKKRKQSSERIKNSRNKFANCRNRTARFETALYISVVLFILM